MLDPQRVALNAESVGFLQRTGQEVDWDAFQKAMQTDYNNQNSAVQVRREREAAKKELHVMGGELQGFESNELVLTQARQQRQINGYPLRQFSADQPAVVLPKKYGGFPLYNRNQLDYPELVSVFTEPMSAPLQSNTELLGRMGAVAMTNDAARPYEEAGFINPMTRNYEQLAENENQFIQRKHLQRMSSEANQRKTYFGGNDIYINPNGQPMSQASEEMASEIAEANNGFVRMANTYMDRMEQNLNRESTFPNNAELRATPNNNIATLPNRTPTSLRVSTRVDNERSVAPLEEMNTDDRIMMGLTDEFRRIKRSVDRALMQPIAQTLFAPTPGSGPATGMQGLSLTEIARQTGGITPGPFTPAHFPNANRETAQAVLMGIKQIKDAKRKKRLEKFQSMVYGYKTRANNDVFDQSLAEIRSYQQMKRDLRDQQEVGAVLSGIVNRVDKRVDQGFIWENMKDRLKQKRIKDAAKEANIYRTSKKIRGARKKLASIGRELKAIRKAPTARAALAIKESKLLSSHMRLARVASRSRKS